MQWKTWFVDIDGYRRKVEVEWSPPFGRGDVFADGELIYSWAPGWRGMPNRSDFEVCGKASFLRKKGFVFSTPELYVDGELIT